MPDLLATVVPTPVADQLISVCIPTYNRPGMLLRALNSCFAQSWPEVDIVVGDDSSDDASAELIETLPPHQRSRIDYRHHHPSLGQNGNVNDLFARAKGSRLLLLHDDDMLLPTAVEELARLWEKCSTLDAAFGKQLLIEDDGTPLPLHRSEELNARYHRVVSNAGRQPLSVVAGLRRMFPNDGFLVTAKLARNVGYRSMEEVGHACDTDFGIRLCAEARDLWFLDAFTLQYRVSARSISKTSIVTPYTYNMLASLKVPPQAQTMLDDARREIVPSAVSGFAQLGQPGRALGIFFSSDYTMRQRLSPRGIFHLFRIVRAYFSSF